MVGYKIIKLLSMPSYILAQHSYIFFKINEDKEINEEKCSQDLMNFHVFQRMVIWHFTNILVQDLWGGAKLSNIDPHP